MLAFLGLPSLHGIIEAIAKGFFGAFAGALVPGFLKHGSVATIQHLVALPDPASWSHVGQLQGDMVYLGASLLPVTLAVGTVRYWMMGFTGSAHPAGAIGRCVGATGVLVAYRWIVAEVVAGTNTLTHAILAFPVVGDGLVRIISVLFGGALLVGGGGVFGAFLVIVGVLFAAGLFALQVLLTVVLAMLIVAGPPLIALSAIPELSHLARTWAHALMAVALVPIGWTVLFATAGALCLDATSFTGGAGGLSGHVAAAFAGLITFVLAVKLPLMLLGELRHMLGAASLRGGGGGQGQSTMPGAERMRAAHTRLRSAAFEGVPSLGRSAGRAAGAMGAPTGGAMGAARRGLAGAARRTGIVPGATAGIAAGAAGGAVAGGAASQRSPASRARGGLRERVARAGAVLINAPQDARTAMTSSSRKAARVPGKGGPGRATARNLGTTGADSAKSKAPTSAGARKPRNRRASKAAAADRPRPSRAPSSGGGSSRPTPRTQPKPQSGPAPAGQARAKRAAPATPSQAHPGQKVTANARREATTPAKPTGPPSTPPRPQRPKRQIQAKRAPRPRSEP
jgi:hypothetical protein